MRFEVFLYLRTKVLAQILIDKNLTTEEELEKIWQEEKEAWNKRLEATCKSRWWEFWK